MERGKLIDKAKKACFLVVLVGIIFASTACNLFVKPEEVTEIPDGIEVVPNGSFEELDENDMADGFRVTTFNGSPKMVVDKEIARTGKHSVRISVTGDAKDRGSVAIHLPLEGGETYKMTVWARPAVGTSWEEYPDHAVARMQAWSDAGRASDYKVNWSLDWTQEGADTRAEVVGGENLHLYPAATKEEDGWYRIEAVFTLPNQIVLVDVALFNWFGTEAVWYDDLSVIKL